MTVETLGIVKRALLRIVSLGLLVQGLAAWAILFGLFGTPGFNGLTFSERNLAVVQAVACPIAMCGAWFAVDWGAVLWGIVVASLLIALILDASDTGIVTTLLLVHGTVLVLWCILAWRTRRVR